MPYFKGFCEIIYTIIIGTGGYVCICPFAPTCPSDAKNQLGDVVHVELPALDNIVEAGQACAVVESAKAAYDILAPVSGNVTKINNNLEENPQLVNEYPYGEGWFFIVELEYPQQLRRSFII